MAGSPLKPCSRVGCRNLTRRRYCADHKRSTVVIDIVSRPHSAAMKVREDVIWKQVDFIFINLWYPYPEYIRLQRWKLYER
jgi:hypothetical protein